MKKFVLSRQNPFVIMIIEAFTMKKSSFNEIFVAPDAADLE